MKKLLVICFLLISFLGFGQQVNAPDPKSFTQNTAGQDASGFVLSGFSPTATLLCAIGLPNTVAGTTFSFTTTSGVTPSTGYTMSGNKTRISFTGTQANINAVLASMKINTSGTNGDINISVSATVNPTGYFYLPTNGHFYRPISGFSGVTGFSGTSPTAYNNLKTFCTQQTFKGQTGYLMTITSSDEDNFVVNNVPGNNIIFALTDNVTEGRFVIDAGPENGTVVRIGTTNQQGRYNNWANGEPNNWGPGEDYVVTKWNGSQWNDFGPEATAFPGGLGGYVIEFGTWNNPDDQTFTDFYNNAVTHTNGPDLSVKALFTFNFGTNVTETNFSAKLLKRNNTTAPWSSAGDYKALNGLGKVYLSNQLDTARIFSSAILISPTNDMQAYSESDIGKVYKMTITGQSGGAVWGTDIYTSDSHIPSAAIHAGVIAVGQTKEVYIKIVEGKNNYPASTRNGVTTAEWGSWGLSYQFVNEPSSYKANTSPGQVEWCVIYEYDAVNKRYRVGIDNREFNGTNVTPSTVSKLKLFDLWDGPVTYKSSDIYWNEYWIYTDTQFNYAGSSYASNLRAGNGFYGVSAEFSFTQNGTYKQHKLEFQQYDTNELKTLYNSIVSVSDVFLAFKEVSNTGLFGNQSGNEFGYGIQFHNADVDGNGTFNEEDCFRLLQDLTGVKNLIDTYTLDNTMKIIPDSAYSTIGKSNWNEFPSYLGKEFGFTLLDGVINYNYNLSVTWKGDVNLSHSAQQAQPTTRTQSTEEVINADVWTELKDNYVVGYIEVNPLEIDLTGVQFILNYDNSILEFESVEYKTSGNPTNFGTNRGTFINLGSIINNGSGLLDNKTQYIIKFKTKSSIKNSFGLVSIGGSDAVSLNGNQLKVNIQ
jgi:hypothetical protein